MAPMTALAVRDPTACPTCGGRVETIHLTQAPLLRHGGYGAARRTSLRWCPCGWDLIAETSEVRP